MSVETFCDVLALLRKAPRTMREICTITGLDERTASRYLRAFEAEGHASSRLRQNPRGKPSRVYTWQDELHAAAPK